MMADRPNDGSAWATASNDQKSQLARMRLVSTGLLVVMAVLFLMANALVRSWPWVAYPRAFAEAAVVGACADWFAVVALFRHPFGVPIPHTAIVPRQRERIAGAIGRFISRHFLAPEELAGRIERIDVAGWLVEWLRKPENVSLAVSRSKGIASPLLDVITDEQIRNFSRSVIMRGIDSIALAPLIARGLSVLSAQGHYDAIFDFCSDATRKFLEEHQGAIRNRVVKGSFRWLPGRIDERVADAILSELIATLLAARNGPQHPWRIEGRETVDRLIIKLVEDQELCDQFERFKARLLDQSVVQGYLEWLCKEIETRVWAETNSKVGLLGSGVDQGLNAFANWLDGSEHHRHLINRWVHDLSFQLVVSNRNEIGTFVAEIVGSWETETLVQRLELQVGKDLQYIRINGTLVGGMVGLFIFILGRFFSAI
jgi:uncharacterized membrane-anchored protein YjiN (DUF445 family)